MRDHHRALIYTMVIVFGASSKLADAEVRIIEDIVGHFPVFRDFGRDKLAAVLNDCVELIGRESGFEETLDAIKTLLPAKLRETGYAIACDLVASDGEATQEERQILVLLRHRLAIDRLVAAAIERGARARFMTL